MEKEFKVKSDFSAQESNIKFLVIQKSKINDEAVRSNKEFNKEKDHKESQKKMNEHTIRKLKDIESDLIKSNRGLEEENSILKLDLQKLRGYSNELTDIKNKMDKLDKDLDIKEKDKELKLDFKKKRGRIIKYN